MSRLAADHPLAVAAAEAIARYEAVIANGEPVQVKHVKEAAEALLAFLDAEDG